ncbi:mechanosensitive ion channel family protein [Allopontixanthobacter sediminis]|uniref:Mechanosensitive ion channel n=1 Tax=Allopontixanthobacter sediminis TaxID=1689985 RepID=A0A845BB18_9SPHN|nr:mechanosensitive ion channel domain-containing protein [Allopontixanthobacter sediminis]MXP44779.1 mechanosensitive ion channel [Allopontixanthobacter sediminis]
MFDEYLPRNFSFSWEEAAITALAFAVVLVVALLLHWIVFAILRRIASMSSTPVDGMVFDRLYKPLRWSFIAIGISVLAASNEDIARIWGVISGFVVPALLGWVTLSVARAFTDALEYRTEISVDPVAARSRRTRISILSRTATFAIVLITTGLMLFSIPAVKEVGVTLMASAGLAALALGAAAQPTLKSLIAGLQMAITEPLRLGDLVVVDGHTGRVEEIRMSFVIVRTWDERAIVVPTSSFLDQSFENWSRTNEMLTGPVYLHLDPATDVEPIRKEFERYLHEQELWDERTGSILMTEAHPESIELRLAVSSRTIGDLFALRCAVREHMVAWLRKEMPDALIRHRLEVEAANQRVLQSP